MRCKHDIGWCLINRKNIFIFETGEVTFDFQGKNRKSYKLEFQCNRPDCIATRNIYIKAKIVKYGRISFNKSYTNMEIKDGE